MSVNSELADAGARAAIRSELGATLFVEAGAGSGKTASLVARVVETVLVDGVRLRDVAAVTFTEKAGAELRDRLRSAFEEAAATAHGNGDTAAAVCAEEALDDLDGAAIGTLHSFAQRALAQHPIEAGLPPLIEVTDEVGSQVAFDDRWTALRAALLEDEALRPTLLLALAAGVRLEQLRSVAHAFNGEWDRLPAAVLDAGPPMAPVVRIDDALAAARDLAGWESECMTTDDNLFGHVLAVRAWADALEMGRDDETRLQRLADAEKLKSSHGQRANWPGCTLDDIRAEIKSVKEEAARLLQQVIDGVLRVLAYRLALDTIAAAHARQAEGRLEFHDLLVLARELVRSERHGEEVRARLHDRYRRILLDEFQDADPIQIELAVRIAGGVAGGADDWRDVPVPDGSLFVVGDPKQSIYRFRRADITTYLDAQDRIGRHVQLTTNFRSTPTVLDWVNTVFDRLITPEPESQPPYRALQPDRADAPGGTHVLVLGREPHATGTKAPEVRDAEAAEVAAAIRTALADDWQVFDQRDDCWRPVRLGDIAVLVPARTSLPQLEQALDAADVPFRAEASSLVYRTPEVRDLLMTARAVDDPSDGLALVSALRSPLFGCGDDDLWTWKHAGGSFNLLAPIREEVSENHPVRDAVAYLKALHDDRNARAPSELLDRIARDRRMFEVAALGPRGRDVWRRLRFVIDHARAWSESEHGALRSYLGWARRQGDESARVAEAILPETDTDAVRVMTIHAAKGLEFPVVIVSGLSSRPGGGRGGIDVLWPRRGGYELRLGKSLQTGDFEAAKPIDEQMDYHERIRLLYVACTRARDHLVVSLHRADRPPPDASKYTNAELLAGAAPPPTGEQPVLERPLPDRVTPAPATDGDVETFAAWSRRLEGVRAASARPSTVSASSLEGTEPAGGKTVEAETAATRAGLAKGPRDLDLPPWTKGRYGTAIGRAVHGALQTVDLATGAGLGQAVAAQTLVEGVLEHEGVVLELCRAALASDVVKRAAARQHWRETYVGTELPDGTVLEGYVDLLYREDDGSLVIVDYKADGVPLAALEVRTRHYRPQMIAYAEALSRALGEPVTTAVLLFLRPEAAVERRVTVATDDPP